ncbi:MAG TPA: hypothetical protein VHY30_11440 [Verrucomicrobiae bacterium]|nr:hypothetical protein [Verrucomicrobiae bacterium]
MEKILVEEPETKASLLFLAFPSRRFSGEMKSYFALRLFESFTSAYAQSKPE